MTITECALFRYAIALNSEMTLHGRHFNSREGFILRFTDDSGRCGAGEIAPLPGFSHETDDDICESVSRLRFAVHGTAVPSHLEELSGGFETWIGHAKAPPSVRFGLETAILRLMSRDRRCGMFALLSDTAKSTVLSQALLFGSHEDILDKSRTSYDQGFRTFKVKVGRGAIADDRTVFSAVRHRVGESAVIRADANCAWDSAEALSYLECAKQANVAYVEEPTNSWEELEHCFSQWQNDKHAPIALDEHLSRFTPETLPDHPAIAAIVIKPSLLGMEQSMRMARRARLLGKQAVFSSPFETSVGLSATAFLASASGEPHAHGFDAYSLLASDLPGVATCSTGPNISLNQFTDLEQRILWSELTEVNCD